MKDSDLTLGEKIKSFRKRAVMSQLELEALIDASTGSISRIENDEVNPTKETLLKIVEKLELNPYDAAMLFNLDVSQNINNMLEISKELSNVSNLNEALDLITSKLISHIDVFTTTIWLWDEESQSLKLSALNTRSDVLVFVKKISRIELLKLELLVENPLHRENHYLKSFILDKIIESYRLYDLAYPFFSKQVSKLIHKWLNLKIAVNIPLRFKDKKIGVLGIQWKKSRLSEGDLMMIKTFADQIAIAIYNAQRYSELERKYLELKKKYE